jgi:hypothetical protein
MSSPYVEPPGPPEHWNVKQNKYWLASRNLSKEGNAKDLRERVYSYMHQDGGPPPVADVSHVSNRRRKREIDPTDTEDPSAVSTDEKVSAVSEPKGSGSVPLLFIGSEVQCGYCNKICRVSTLVKHHWLNQCVIALQAKATKATGTTKTSIALNTYSPEEKVERKKKETQEKNHRNYCKRKWKEILPKVAAEYELLNPKPILQIATNVAYPKFKDFKCVNRDDIHSHWKCNPFFVPEDIAKDADQEVISYVRNEVLRFAYKQKDSKEFWTSSFFKKIIKKLHPDKTSTTGLKNELLLNINCYKDRGTPKGNRYKEHIDTCAEQAKKQFCRLTKNIMSDEEIYQLAIDKWEKEKNKFIDEWSHKGYDMWMNRDEDAEAKVNGKDEAKTKANEEESIDLISISSGTTSTSISSETPPPHNSINHCCAGTACVVKNYHEVAYSADCQRCGRSCHPQCLKVDPLYSDRMACIKCVNENTRNKKKK